MPLPAGWRIQGPGGTARTPIPGKYKVNTQRQRCHARTGAHPHEKSEFWKRFHVLRVPVRRRTRSVSVAVRFSRGIALVPMPAAPQPWLFCSAAIQKSARAWIFESTSDSTSEGVTPRSRRCRDTRRRMRSFSLVALTSRESLASTRDAVCSIASRSSSPMPSSAGRFVRFSRQEHSTLRPAMSRCPSA